MSTEERAALEAELHERVTSAEAAVRMAARSPGDAPTTDYVAWWRGIADAHKTLADAYQAALRSDLCSSDSLMWAALSEAHWHNTQEAKRATHEANLASDRAGRSNATQPERAS